MPGSPRPVGGAGLDSAPCSYAASPAATAVPSWPDAARYEPHPDPRIASAEGSPGFDSKPREEPRPLAVPRSDWTLGTAWKITLAIGISVVVWAVILASLFWL